MRNTPWKQAEDEFSIFIEDKNGKIIADVRPPNYIAGVDEAMREHRAIARVMAASPEMLEALQTLVLYYEKLENRGDFYDDVKAIIAKAVGA